MGTKITKKMKTESRPAKVGKNAPAPPERRSTVKVPASAKREAMANNATKPCTEISTELIALRAYFLSENRAAAGIASDSLSDWLEAERQLNSEQK